MKRITLSLFSCLLSFGVLSAQQGVTQCGVPTGQTPFPVLTYTELPDPMQPVPREWAMVKTPHVSWGSTDVRYAKHKVPQLKQQNTLKHRIRSAVLLLSG